MQSSEDEEGHASEDGELGSIGAEELDSIDEEEKSMYLVIAQIKAPS